MTTSADRWNDALKLLEAGQLPEAEAMLRALAKEAILPDQGNAILARLSYNRAVSIWTQDLAGAEALLRESTRLAPTAPEGRLGLAEILVRRAADDIAAGLWAAATAGAMEAVQLWPEIGSGLPVPVRSLAERLHQGAVAVAGKDPVLATRLALAAWGLDPTDRALYATARSLFVHLGLGGTGPRVEAGIFEAALQADPRDLVALLGLANLRRKERRLTAAEELCRFALQHHPDNPFAVGRLASVLVSGTRIQEADRLYQTLGRNHGGVESVIRMMPDFFDALPAEREAPERQPEERRDFVIFAGCDAAYFHRFGDALANSIARYCPSATLHFHVVNPDAEVEPRVAAAKARLPGIEVRLTVEQAPSRLQGDALRTFFACARFLVLPDLIRRHGCPVLMLDIDAVVLRDPRALVAQLRTEAADLAWVKGDQEDPWCQYWADAILAAPSPRALEYLDLVRRYLRHFLAADGGVWFLDQVALFAARIGGFEGRPAPRFIDWPTDIQNSDTRLAYFWSLHMSQPTNETIPDSALYKSFKDMR